MDLISEKKRGSLERGAKRFAIGRTAHCIVAGWKKEDRGFTGQREDAVMGIDEKEKYSKRKKEEVSRLILRK